MAEVFKIGSHDWTNIIEAKGYGWSRNDLDSESTKRTKNGTLRRSKITTKRKLSYTTIPQPRSTLAQLDDDLSASTFQATYLDLHGVMTKTFYCSSFEVTFEEVNDSGERCGSVSFNIIEV